MEAMEITIIDSPEEGLESERLGWEEQLDAKLSLDKLICD